jgi:hypothetical protein
VKSFGESEKLAYGPRRKIATVERKLLKGSTVSVTGAELAKGISGCTDKSQPFEGGDETGNQAQKTDPPQTIHYYAQAREDEG